jgi:hypothetical protein
MEYKPTQEKTMSKKNKEKKKKKNPTHFVLGGQILEYNGSMLELHGQVDAKEWEVIIEETISFKVFVECLKEVGMPLLEEKWEKDDQKQLDALILAVSRIRNIDPLLAASINQDELKKKYTTKMKLGASDIDKMVKEIRATEIEDKSEVSDL